MDSTEVTLIDDAGRGLPAEMHRQGAEFGPADCLTNEIVDEITQTPGGDRGRPK